MPNFSTETTLSKDSDLTVLPVLEYSTFWSQYVENNQINSYLYYIFSLLFFLQFSLKILKNGPIMILIEPKVFPIEIAASRDVPTDNLLAFSAKTQYEPKHPNSILYRILRYPYILTVLFTSFYKKQKISLVILDPQLDKVDPIDYTIENSEDTLRPTIVLE